jgi:enoyl-CoA hydratase/carnithine racemase
VIAAVNGLAIGGGQVLQVVCDVSIAAEHARFGQAGPRVGSFDAGYGTAYLARVVGEKRARELWFFCRQIDAGTAERWAVNAVVPKERSLPEAARGARGARRPRWCFKPRQRGQRARLRPGSSLAALDVGKTLRPPRAARVQEKRPRFGRFPRSPLGAVEEARWRSRSQEGAGLKLEDADGNAVAPADYAGRDVISFLSA